MYKVLTALLFIGLFSCGDSKPFDNPTSSDQDDLSTSSAPSDTSVVSDSGSRQSVEDRILEIKTMYKDIQALDSKGLTNKCNKKVKVIYDGLMPDQEFPFDNEATQCSLKHGYSYKRADFFGYEWAEETTYYFKEEKLFFVYSIGGAEACAHEYRVYFGQEGNVIRVLEKANDCDGEEPINSIDVTGTDRSNEIVTYISGELDEVNTILEQ